MSDLEPIEGVISPYVPGGYPVVHGSSRGVEKKNRQNADEDYLEYQRALRGAAARADLERRKMRDRTERTKQGLEQISEVVDEARRIAGDDEAKLKLFGPLIQGHAEATAFDAKK